MNKIEQAIKKISSGQPMNCACEYCERDRWAYELALAALNEQLGATTCDEALADTPTIDVAPVVHGRWIVVKSYGKTALYRCTACKTDMVDYIGRGDYHRYCHSCGARMDGGIGR